MAKENVKDRLNRNCLYSFQNVADDKEFQKHVSDLPSNAPDGAKEPIEYNIFRTGKFKHPLYGDDLEFDQEYVEKLVANYRRGVVPERLILNVGHKSDNGELGAIGHFDDVKLKGGTIETPFGEKERIFVRARLILNSKGIELYKDRRYLFSSSEIHPDYTTREKFDISDDLDEDVEDEDTETLSTVSHGPTLTGLAATNKPFINNLGQSIQTGSTFSYSEEVQEAKKPQVFSKPVLEDNEGNVRGFNRDTLVYADPDNDKLKNNLLDDNKIVEKDKDNSQDFYNFSEVSAISKDSDTQKEDKNNFKDKDQERDIMKLTELMSDLDDMELSEQVDHLSDKVDEVEGEQKDLVEQLYTEKKERLQAEKARKKAVAKQQRYKEENEELEEKTIELKNKITEAKEGSKSAQIKEFRKRLEEEGYTEAAIQTVEDCLMSLSADQFGETYELTFSEGDSGEQQKELSIKGMFEQVFASLQGGPVSEEFSSEESPDMTVDGDEKEVNPDEGAEVEEDEGGEVDVEFDDSHPERVKKFAKRNNFVPPEDDWGQINKDGYHVELEKDKIQ